MIKLTINPEKESKVHTFEKDSIVIGSTKSENSDLDLEGETLTVDHLKIIKENGKFVIYNTANDPFVTINDSPFGKRRLKNADRILIGSTSVLFEGTIEKDTSQQSTTDLEEIVERKISPQQPSSSASTKAPSSPLVPKNFEISVPNFTPFVNLGKDTKETIDLPPSPTDSNEEHEEIFLFDEGNEKKEEERSNQATNEEKNHELEHECEEEIDIDALVREVENLDLPSTEPESPQPEEHSNTNSQLENSNTANHDPEPSSTQKNNKAKSPADFFNDLLNEPENDEANEDDSDLENYDEEVSENSQSNKWKVWVAACLLFITTIGVISSGVYNRLDEKSYRNEIIAARAVSDVALALTYAQLNHIKPQQQNWSDPHFLRNNIHSVLSHSHDPMANVDNSGRLNDGKYLLRIYTNTDSSRFLVIAQPEPSLAQWLAPQKAIVIDSKSMVIHRINDLKPLNRLLVNQNSLSGENGREIFESITNEEIIALNELADSKNQNGFAPPKQLEFMNLAAENYVYNAPRYSQIGEKLMEQAIDIASRPSTSAETKKLQDEINSISKLKDPVLYTSKGMKVALKAQEALTRLRPNENFLVAYINFDEDGNVNGTHLILDVEPKGKAEAHALANLSGEFNQEVGSYQPLIVAAKAPEYLTPVDSENTNSSKSFQLAIDKNSPLYVQINKLALARSEVLSPIGNKIITLIQENNRDANTHFDEQLTNLISQYKQTSSEMNEATVKALKNLYDEHDYLSMSEFSQYVTSAGLDGLSKSYFSKVADEEVTEALTEEQFQEILTSIENSNNFRELDAITNASAHLLRLDNIPDSVKLISFQNDLRTKVLEKLNEILFSPENEFPASEKTEENRALLSKVLFQSWVIDPEEQEFYLNEYDKLMGFAEFIPFKND
ncbi:MAG: FHA domain-containing protein [Chlamydiota bacterium]|nr:FHA domain-containing protein [Chlamydiota bacterium]